MFGGYPLIKSVMSAKILGCTAIGLLVIIICGKASSAFLYFLSLGFSFDNYFLLDAARELTATGVGKITILPHSTQAWDLFLWSYYLPMYAYGYLVHLFDLEFHQTALVHFGQYLALIGALFLFLRRYLSWPWVLVAIVIVLLEPLYDAVASKHFNNWPIVFALLSWTVYDAYLSSAGRNVDLRSGSLAALTGGLASASLFSFPAIGLPVFGGMAVAIFLETLQRKSSLHDKVLRLAAYAIGSLVLFGIFIADFLTSLHPQIIAQLFATLSFHYSDIADSGLTQSIMRAGYFIAGIGISPWAPTLIPVGICATVLAWRCELWSTQKQRSLVHLGLLLTAIWILGGILFPHHINSVRLVAVLPIYVIIIAFILQAREVSPAVFGCLIVTAASFNSVQVIYHALDRPAHPFGIGIGTAVAIAFALLLVMAGRQAFTHWTWAKVGRIIGLRVFALLLMCPLMVPILTENIDSLWTASKVIWRDGDTRPLLPAMARQMMSTMEDSLKPGDLVVTNVAMKELYPPGVRLHLVRFYRGLFNGATKIPATKLILIGKDPSGRIYPNFNRISVGQNVYFRGHVYHVHSKLDLVGEYFAFIGNSSTQVESWADEVIFPEDYVGKERIERYLKWRQSKGFQIN